MNALGKILFFAGCGKGHADIVILTESFKFIGHFCKSVVIASADFEGGVHENIADVIVTRSKTGKEAIECVEVGNIVLVDVDETYAVVNVIAEVLSSFDGDDSAAAVFNRIIDAVHKEFRFAGAFKSDYKFDHFNVSLCSLYYHCANAV